MLRIHHAALTALVVTALAAPAGAQNVTQVEIQRLQDNIFQASTDVSQLRSRDASRASQLQTELDDLRDEVIYLKVKLRKERIAGAHRVRRRARSDRGSSHPRARRRPRMRLHASSAARPAGAASRARPATDDRHDTRRARRSRRAPKSTCGSDENLNSGIAQVEDRFEATTLVDVNVNGRTAIPAGSVMRGVVTAVEPATRTNRTARMTVSFDQVTVNGRAYPMRGTVTQAIEGEGIKGETARIGTGAGVGAIIGGILGGFKGALAGILIGGGGTIAATEGKEVDLPQGSVLRVRIDSPVQITNAR